MLRGIGVNTVAMTPGGLRDLQPFANVDDIGAAAWEPEAGMRIRPRLWMDSRAGRPSSARRSASGLRSGRSCAASRVIGVETSAGRIDAGAVVVAAGAWAPRICREIGIELPARPKGLDTVQVTRPRALAQPT